MQTDYLIAVDEFCANHNIEISFISTLQQNGLIKITTIREARFIDQDQLLQLEKIIRLYIFPVPYHLKQLPESPPGLHPAKTEL